MRLLSFLFHVSRFWFRSEAVGRIRRLSARLENNPRLLFVTAPELSSDPRSLRGLSAVQHEGGGRNPKTSAARFPSFFHLYLLIKLQLHERCFQSQLHKCFRCIHTNQDSLSANRPLDLGQTAVCSFPHCWHLEPFNRQAWVTQLHSKTTASAPANIKANAKSNASSRVEPSLINAHTFTDQWEELVSAMCNKDLFNCWVVPLFWNVYAIHLNTCWSALMRKDSQFISINLNKS